jgi:hypothetical protein
MFSILCYNILISWTYITRYFEYSPFSWSSPVLYEFFINVKYFNIPSGSRISDNGSGDFYRSARHLLFRSPAVLPCRGNCRDARGPVEYELNSLLMQLLKQMMCRILEAHFKQETLSHCQPL